MGLFRRFVAHALHVDESDFKYQLHRHGDTRGRPTPDSAAVKNDFIFGWSVTSPRPQPWIAGRISHALARYHTRRPNITRIGSNATRIWPDITRAGRISHAQAGYHTRRPDITRTG